MKPITLASLIVMVALALAAAAPSSALAGEFEAVKYPATIKGEATETQILTLEAGLKVKCKHATFAGELTQPSETLTLAPSYSECTAAGIAATMEMKGCEYQLKAGAESEENKSTGTTSIVCSGGNKIKIAFASCEVQIGAQSGLESNTYRNNLEGSPPNVTMEESLGGIHYTVTKNESLCFSGTGEKTGGTLAGKSLLKGTVGAESVGIAVASEQPLTNAKLCEEPPEAKTGKCPVGKAYPAKTMIEGASTKAQISLFEKDDGGGEIRSIVECGQSDLIGKTEVEEGKPIKLESLSVTFAKCKTVSGGGTCATVNMKNSPTTKATVATSTLLGAGNGRLLTPLTLEVQCEKEPTCEYATAALRNEQIRFTGGMGATLEALGVMPLNKIAGPEKNCFKSARLTSAFSVTMPKKVWVTH